MLNYTSTRKKTVDHINSTAGKVKSVLYDNGIATIDYEKGATIKLPIKAGSGIVIDTDEAGTGLEIHSDNGGGSYDAYLCSNLTDGGYGNGVSFIIYSATSITTDADIIEWFNKNVSSSIYPASGGYKYGGGGSDTAYIYGVYLSPSRTELRAGYVHSSDEYFTVSNLTITKLT